LIGLDGSSNSRSVLELGLRWAKRFDALAVGIGIIDEPGLTTTGAMLFGGGHHWHTAARTQLLYRARHRVDLILEEFTGRCAEVGVNSRTLEDVGFPFAQILMEAQCYDLILLGQQSHFDNVSRGESDETLRLVLQDSPRPVVAVPKSPSGGESIVVAYDGSLHAAHALHAPEASGLAGSKLVDVVSIAPHSKDAARHADRAVGFLRLHGIEALPHQVVTSVPPAEVIMNKVCYLEAGLLVMGARGERASRDVFVGSVTLAVLKESPVPVFCSY